MTMLDDLVAELCGDGGPAVETIETHVSWVLLGAEVFKIKKPVTLPFLDYASLEARERFCHEEVRINRRLAPTTYLGVVPIYRDAQGRFSFHPRGEIADWAVRMRRLDDDARADVMLARGTLTPDAIDRIASGIARFHETCETGPEIAQAGSIEAIERNVLDNFDAARTLPAHLVPAKDTWEVEAWQLAVLRGHRADFERRIADGRIRDGHGDLRLEHVFFTGEATFEVIDGIEFDPRYRHADVGADVAFLTMDLRRLGRVDLAERLLARYARETNDFDLYGVVDFYESYRAMVRAKIASMVASEAMVDDARWAGALAQARRDLVLALSARHRTVLPPLVVAVAGGIAAGKSTLANALADELGAPVIEADRTRKHMLGLASTTHADVAAWSGPYDVGFSDRVYAEVLRRAAIVLASGRSVVLDASFRSKEARHAARELAATFGVPFRLLECTAARETCRTRLRARDRATATSDGRLEIYDAFASSFEPIRELPPTEHFTIDTSTSIEKTIARAHDIVETWPRRLVS